MARLLATILPGDIRRPQELVAIEEVPLGARVPTLHPIQENVASSDEETDYSTWKVVKIEFAHKSGSIVDMELLRSPEWIAENGFEVGSTFRAFAKEIETRRLGRVVGIEDAPEILPGEGSLVVGRYRTRENDELVTVYFANGLTLSGTKNHPVWLPSEEVWVGLGELEAGDTLLSRYGLVTVAQVTSHPAAPVYNISVQQQHVYEVTEWGIVVHNNDWCEELQELRKKKQDAEARGEKLSDADQKRLGELEDWARSKQPDDSLNNESGEWLPIKQAGEKRASEIKREASRAFNEAIEGTAKQAHSGQGDMRLKAQATALENFLKEHSKIFLDLYLEPIRREAQRLRQQAKADRHKM